MDDEERFGAGLREMMLTVDVPPPRTDVPAAIRVGRRRDQRRIVAIAALSVVVVAGAVVGYATTGPRRAGPDVVGVSPSAPAQRCAPTVLPGSPSRVVATDPTGRYYVGVRDAGSTTKVVLWTDGQPQELNVTGMPVAVNAKGLIIGYDGQDQTSRAWIYRNGYKVQLPMLSGTTGSSPTGINAGGDVVGYSMKGSLDRNQPLYWPSDQPDKVRALNAPSTIGDKSVASMRASGINDDRTIVGWIREAPVYWSPDGSAHTLALPAGYDSGNPLHLRGGYAYGTLGTRGKGDQPVARWDLAAGGPPTVVTQVAHRLADGTPTGWTLAADPTTTSVLFDPNGVATPIRPPGKETVFVPMSISDDARTIVGVAGDDGATPVVWRC